MDTRRSREAKSGTYATLLLGVMMLFVGLGMMIHSRFPPDDGFELFRLADGPWAFVGRSILVAGGFILLIYRRKGNYFAVGVYAMALGLSRIVRLVPGLFDESDLKFYYTIVMLIIAFNMALGGYNHLTVRTRNPTMMRITAILMLSVYLVALIYMYVNELPIRSVLSSTADLLWYLPLYVALLVILSTKEITHNVPITRIKRYSRSMSFAAYIGDYVSVSEEDADAIREGLTDTSGWQERSVANMHVRERRITFRTDIGDRDVILNRVSGIDGLLISVIDDSTDSFVAGKRFNVRSYKESRDVMELYDSNGVCAVIRVGGEA